MRLSAAISSAREDVDEARVDESVAASRCEHPPHSPSSRASLLESHPWKSLLAAFADRPERRSAPRPV